MRQTVAKKYRDQAQAQRAQDALRASLPYRNPMTQVIPCSVGSGPYPGTSKVFMAREEYLARLAIMRATPRLLFIGYTEDGMARYSGYVAS